MFTPLEELALGAAKREKPYFQGALAAQTSLFSFFGSIEQSPKDTVLSWGRHLLCHSLTLVSSDRTILPFLRAEPHSREEPGVVLPQQDDVPRIFNAALCPSLSHSYPVHTSIQDHHMNQEQQSSLIGQSHP